MRFEVEEVELARREGVPLDALSERTFEVHVDVSGVWHATSSCSRLRGRTSPTPVSPLELVGSDRHCSSCSRAVPGLWPSGPEMLALSRAVRIAEESVELRALCTLPLSVHRCVLLRRTLLRLGVVSDPLLPVSLEGCAASLSERVSEQLVCDQLLLSTLSPVDRFGALLLRDQDHPRASPLVRRTHAAWERAVLEGLTQAEALAGLDPSGRSAPSFRQRLEVLRERCSALGAPHLLVVREPLEVTGRYADPAPDELLVASCPVVASFGAHRMVLVPHLVAERVSQETGFGWDFGPAADAPSAVLETALALWADAGFLSPFATPDGALEAARRVGVRTLLP